MISLLEFSFRYFFLLFIEIEVIFQILNNVPDHIYTNFRFLGKID